MVKKKGGLSTNKVGRSKKSGKSKGEGTKTLGTNVSANQNSSSSSSDSENNADITTKSSRILAVQRKLRTQHKDIKDIKATQAHFAQEMKEQSQDIKAIQQQSQDIKASLQQVLQVMQHLVQGQVDAQRNTGELTNNTISAAVQASYIKYSQQIAIKLTQDEVRIQIESMNRYELDSLQRYHGGLSFWKYVSTLHYLQMAVFMEMLQLRQLAARTISNNYTSMKVIAQVYKEQNTPALTFEVMKQVDQLIVQKYKGVHQISTVNNYLKDFSAMVRRVCGIQEFRRIVDNNHFPVRQPIVSQEHFFKLIEYYRGVDDERLQLFGFCLYLLYLTGERNETIRTLRFDQFHELAGEAKYVVSVVASKTSKGDNYPIPQTAYNFVQRLHKLRIEEVQIAREKLAAKQAGPNADEAYAKRRAQILERRVTYVFTFFTQSALHYHIKKLKANPPVNNIDYLAEFIVHNIRALKIRAAYAEGGMKKAKQEAKHSNYTTTLKHYIDLAQYREVIPWDVKPSINNNAIDEIEVSEDEDGNVSEHELDDNFEHELQLTDVNISKKVKAPEVKKLMKKQKVLVQEEVKSEDSFDECKDDDDEQSKLIGEANNSNSKDEDDEGDLINTKIQAHLDNIFNS